MSFLSFSKKEKERGKAPCRGSLEAVRKIRVVNVHNVQRVEKGEVKDVGKRKNQGRRIVIQINKYRRNEK
ncbi:MAG: hypothetical protein PHU54_08130 [Candidatus Omnitrophica bacterium]|nr:hypothetical protein [Candidatus Omnitrophota bacterium]